MKTSDFNYELPEELIAQTPAQPRDSSRLLVYHRDSGEIEHRIFRDVIDYLNTLSQDTALKYYDRLTSEIASLSMMPERCPRPRDLALAAKGYRYLVVGNYLVFYVVAGNVVQIRRILYARRDYKQLL